MKQRIPLIAESAIPTGTIEDHFRLQLQYRPLPLRSKPCGDCAVVCGFYRERSEELRNFATELQEAVSRRWFCHQNPSHACKGNADNLGLDWRQA